MHSNRFHRFSLVAIMLTVACSVLLSSCFHRQRQLGVTGPQRSHLEKLLDSMSFTTHHHYGMGYNFVVKSDSMVLIKQMPEEIVSHLQFDTMCVMKHRRVVVADIHIVPNDKNDSVWVELGTEESRFGWIHEHTLLHQTVPDDPISWFISAFSDTHLIVFLIVLLCIGGAYTVRHQLKDKSHIVHFNDIDSFYPTLLALIVALSATLYATIQNFFPSAWQQFYFHPSLNPFAQKHIMALFLTLVWTMFVVALAAVDDVRKQLPAGEAVVYLLGLFAVCAVDYVVFSITTLYYVGYALFAAYAWFALRVFWRRHHAAYFCGNCGAPLQHKGRCPRCGAINE